MAMAAAEWVPLAVPEWPRSPLRRSRGTDLVPWLSLAACLVLTVLVVARVEMGRGPDGLWISFAGEPQRETVDRVALETRLASQRAQTTAEVGHLIATLETRQLDNLEALLALDRQVDAEALEDALTRFVAEMETRRRSDQMLFQEQILDLLERQNRQTRNLEQLAGYVSRAEWSTNR